MEFLKNWITQIVYIAILSIILELLVPSSSLKKYAKVAIGLVIMITILNPLISFLKGGANLEAQVFKNNYYLKNIDIDQISKEAERQRNNLIVKEYKKRLVEQIKAKILNLYNIDNVDVSVSIVEDMEDKDFGKVKEVVLSFKNAKIVSQKTGEVKKIELGESKPNEKFDYQEIKKTISAFYNAPLKNITIEEK
ncbi:stage III sporulation protein AF [Thermoanaerobacter kivui]|uniref:Stage III sporulation protein AF n=1 Tax=Thermoanaerobacter kivui TaxID=2325 RepID=A0A097ARD8_THEKI|nr:stage III sporulation protein AF [Thermoanaerobacter kivui]AIS52373.1 stage III sporulation protein AF [Thermoanaerobacter kivui]